MYSWTPRPRSDRRTETMRSPGQLPNYVFLPHRPKHPGCWWIMDHHTIFKKQKKTCSLTWESLDFVDFQRVFAGEVSSWPCHSCGVTPQRHGTPALPHGMGQIKSLQTDHPNVPSHKRMEDLRSKSPKSFQKKPCIQILSGLL